MGGSGGRQVRWPWILRSIVRTSSLSLPSSTCLVSLAPVSLAGESSSSVTRPVHDLRGLVTRGRAPQSHPPALYQRFVRRSYLCPRFIGPQI